MDVIVFNQHELDCVSDNIKSVALCDNSFVIRPVCGREYIAIGNVDALVCCSAIDAITKGLVFTGFCPVFDESVKAAEIMQTTPPPCSFTSSFKGSFTSSFATSFAASFSFMHEYEQRSFRQSSFTGSMQLNTSFRKTVVREIAVNGYGLNLI